jgi:hypothetical protein
MRYAVSRRTRAISHSTKANTEKNTARRAENIQNQHLNRAPDKVGVMAPLDQNSALLFAPLMFAFIAKQFVADFPLQTKWMARGKERSDQFLSPLAAHAGVHGIFSTFIAAIAVPALWWLGIVDFVVHFAIDLGKVSISRRTNWQPTDVEFWNLFGLDQMLHQLTGLAFAIVLAGT